MNRTNTYILIVEDDSDLGVALYDFLITKGFDVDVAEDGLIAVAKSLNGNYDAVVLDLSLPCLDGLDVCKQIKTQKPQLPILISTARGQLEDKRKGFELGADDYLAKPYAPEELVWRLQSLTRRNKIRSYVAEEISVGEYSKHIINYNSRDIIIDSNSLRLTEAEFLILSNIIKNAPRILSREEIMSISNINCAKTIDVLIGRIRQKMHEKPKQPQRLITVRGYGYRWNED